MAIKNYPICLAPIAVGMNKKLSDPRHQRRRKLIKTLFAHSFDQVAKRKTRLTYQEIKAIIDKQDAIDKYILQAASRWPLKRINRIDLAILRLAIWELCFQKKEPPKVIIDEAVELAKEFGGENSPSFVNGVLGTIYEHCQKD